MRREYERTPMEPLQLESAAVTDVGRVRSHNEDAYFAREPWFVVADGMGGHEAGELASAAVVTAFDDAPREGVTPVVVSEVLARAQRGVLALSSGRPRSAGTTVTGVAVLETMRAPHWLVFNVGDSRVYRVLDGGLEQLTVDHSLVQELVDQGRMSRAEARVSPHRNVITRALGAGDHEADFFVVPVITGERLIVCSDGLTTEVDDEQVLQVSQEHATPAGCAAALVSAALAHGGHDNVTVLVLDVVAGGTALGVEEDTVARREDVEPRLVDVVAPDEIDEDTARSSVAR